MRRIDFETLSSNKPEQKLYTWEITVKAQTKTFLCPFKEGDVSVRFPLLNASISAPANLILDNGEIFQFISFSIDISMFGESKGESRKQIQNATLITVEGMDGELSLVEPQIIILGELFDIQ